MEVETIDFKRWQWCEEAARGLDVAVGSDGDQISYEVKNCISKLWRVDNGRAWVVTREEGRELVLVCVQGCGVVAVVDAVIKKARKAGFKTMRAHTKRRGLLRMFEPVGAYEKEFVIGLKL